MKKSNPRARVLALVGAGACALACGCGSSAHQTAPVTVTSAEIRPPPRHCPATKASGRLEVVVLGSGGDRSAGRASSGFVVVIDGVPRVLVDAGAGAVARLLETKLDLRGIDTVLITHMHEDHVGDFGQFLRARDAASEQPVTLHVYGPTGDDRHPGARVFVERVFGREGAFQTPAGYRAPLRVDGTDVDHTDHPVTLTTDGGVAIKAVSVDHGQVPTLGYRIEHAGRSIVFSGDLAAKNDNLIELARGADLLVHELAVLDTPSRSERIYEQHARPRRIGQEAARAPVAELLLTHMPNDVRMRQSEVLDSIRTSYGGDVRFADDCMVVSVAE